MPQAARPDNLVSLQWLRAIAALMVVVHHANYHANTLRRSYGWTETEPLGFANWQFGVHIFFVVSGFIMVHTTHDFGTPGAVRRFLMRRIARVVPLYWLVTSVAVLIALISPTAIQITGDRVEYFLKSFAFIPVLRAPDDLRPIVGQGWTLTYEMFFYAAFAVALLCRRIVGLGLLTITFVALTLYGRTVDATSPILYTWTDSLLIEFLMGAYIALAYERGWRLPFAGAVGAIALGAALIVGGFSGPVWLAIGVPAALIVGGAVLGPSWRETAATRGLTLTGDASYSLYLTHTFLMRPLRSAWTLWPAALAPGASYIIASVVLSTFAAIACYRLIEQPMTRAAQAAFTKRRSPIASLPLTTEIATAADTAAGIGGSTYRPLRPARITRNG